jgi:hypothetical protein
MSDLKDFNNKICEAIPFEKKIVSNFPPYYYYQFSAIVSENNFGFGICYDFESTGSRIASQDYSGLYRFDMKIYSNLPSFYGEYNFQIFNNLYGDLNNLNVGIYSMIGIELTRLDINEYLKLGEKTVTNKSYNFNANNVMFHPGIEISYWIKHIGIKLNTGYLFQVKSDAFSKNNDPNGNPYINLYPIKPDWNGYRIGLSIFYRIWFLSEKEEDNTDSEPKDHQWIHKR